MDPPWAGPACPVFLPGWEESGQGLAKSNICERVVKSPPESWFWHRAPPQLIPVFPHIPTHRAGLAGLGTGMSIPPFQWRVVTSEPEPLVTKVRRSWSPTNGAGCLSSTFPWRGKPLDGVTVICLSPRRVSISWGTHFLVGSNPVPLTRRG